MRNSRLTFSSSINFTLPIGAYRILQGDAYYYGYLKNEKPNISGFLNDLLPALSDYQEDLYKNLLKYNNGETDVVKAVARSIHNVYLSPFTFHNDGTTNVPFRIQKNRYDDFITIHDERLSFYNTDFTNYVRTLIVEYASKTFSQREYLFAFPIMRVIRESLMKNQLCKMYCGERAEVFVPVSVEVSPVYDHNYVVGITKELQPIAVRLRDVQKASALEGKIKITSEMCDLITERLDQIYTEEYQKCSD